MYGARKLSTCDIYKAVKHEILQIRIKKIFKVIDIGYILLRLVQDKNI